MRELSVCGGSRGSPLTICDVMRRGYMAQIPLLVSLGADAECRDSSGRTPLMLTAFVDPEEWGVGVARLLIEVGVNMRQRDRHGMNALHHACVYEREELVSVLLNALDFDWTQSDRFGNTALHYAAMSGNITMVQRLISCYTRYHIPIDKPNKKSRTARDEAHRCGHHDCVALLTQANLASSSGKNFHNKDTRNPLQVQVPRQNNIPERSELAAREKPKPFPDTGGGLSSGLFSHQEKPQSPRGSIHASQGSLDSKLKASDSSLSPRRGEQRQGQPNGYRVRSSSGSSFRTEGSVHKRSLLSVRSNSITSENMRNVHSGSENETVPPSDTRKPKPSSVDQKPWTTSGLRDRTNHHLNRERTTNNLKNHERDRRLNSNNLPPRPQTCQRLHRQASALSRTSSQLLPYEKDPGQVIHVASENDFRNSREYVLKLTQMAYSSPAFLHTGSLPDLTTPPPTAHLDPQCHRKPSTAGSWRHSMRNLYHHYEFQCAPSWRHPAKLPAPPPDPSLLSAQSIQPAGPSYPEDMEDCREKPKSRRASSVRPGSQTGDMANIIANAKLRKMAALRQRKGSTSGPSVSRSRSPTQDQSSDGTSVSSAEAVLSMSQVKKKLDMIKADQSASGNGSAQPQPQQNTSKTTTATDNGKPARQDNSSTFITHANENNVAVTSAGNGNGQQAAQDRNPPVAAPTSYAVPTVTEILVTDADTDVQELNTEPANIDSNRLAVFEED